MTASKPEPAVASHPSEVATNGWDPYEVWRTKILLPRLAAQAAPIDASLKAAGVTRLKR